MIKPMVVVKPTINTKVKKLFLWNLVAGVLW